MPRVTCQSDRNKDKVALFVQAVWNEGRLELIDELVAVDYLGRLSSLEADVIGPAGVRRLVSSRRAVHPGLHIKIDEQIAEHDLVVVRWRASAATDHRVARGSTRCCAGITVIRMLAGKQVDSHTAMSSITCEIAA
jgi:hypothetical protein